MDRVAAFDFDETLTYKDTLISFLTYCIGKPAMSAHLVKIAPYALAFKMGMQTRQQVKERFLGYALKGWHCEEIAHKADRFALHEVPKILNPAAIARLKWHQKQNHRCILLSANLESFLAPVAKALEFDDLICSKLAFDSQGKFLGKLVGLNCWGEEKVNRLKLLLGSRANYTLYAYGDSRGDKELLDYADYPFYRKFQ